MLVEALLDRFQKMLVLPSRYPSLAACRALGLGRVVGVDISEEILAQARALTTPIGATAGPTFEYRKINTVFRRETVPLDDGSADAVSTTIVLQEFQSEALLRNALTEMGRIAKTGAQLAAACVSDLITTEDYTTFTFSTIWAVRR